VKRLRDERPASHVPAWLWAALALLLAAQVALNATRDPAEASSLDLPPSPQPQVLRALAFGETAALARVTMLYLQSFDLRGTNQIAYRELDYQRLAGWLRAVLAADPRSEYALFSAARIYAENPDPARSRIMLALLHEAFLDDPDRRWPWLAHAALLAKHRLHDLPLARRYAADLDRHVSAANVPDWARQMEVFILEDMNELEAARILLGGMLAEGRIRDPAERRFLELRLEELERRIESQSKGSEMLKLLKD
jgi:hypothetical protein